MLRIPCSEIWGGIQHADTELCTAGVTASLFSSAADGGKGGDIYYMSVCGADVETRVALADVIGHGETVSRVSTWLYEALAQELNASDDDRVLGRLNALAMEHGIAALTTAAVVSVHATASALQIAYAGHPPAYILRAGESTWTPIDVPNGTGPANLPLGVLHDVRYGQVRCAVSPGDKVFVYTDGLLEAPARDGQPYGEQRLLDTLNAAGTEDPGGVKRAIKQSLFDHVDGAPAHDDVTFMALTVR